MKADLYTADGSKKGTLDLPKVLFEAKINQDLMHRAVLMRLANARTPNAHVQTRGEVAATTKKMFKQKGTGNARRGAKSAPLLRGGSKAHGPRNDRNHSVMMPKKERRAALYSALSAKAADKGVYGLEEYKGTEPKTKEFATLLAKLPVGKKNLFVISERSPVLEMSAANVPGVRTLLAQYLNPYDVLLADQICFVGDALGKAEETFIPTK